jgi:hypothetical protein
MEKFSTEQLKAALVAMRNRADAADAYSMVVGELYERMGDEAADQWFEQAGL